MSRMSTTSTTKTMNATMRVAGMVALLAMAGTAVPWSARAYAADPPPAPPPGAPAGPAAAEGGVSTLATPGASGDRPWAAGVDAEHQKAALAELQAGNALLRDGFLKEASDKYRAALESWDHPGIHYNLALALMNLDQPLEVHEHLTSALKYGPAPLDAEKYTQAQSYLKLVEKQLAPLEVKCAFEGADVKLDGKSLFKSPGHYKGLVRPGTHTVIATKEGYPTTERTKILIPGETTTINLRLYAAGELIEYRRKWPLWRPIALAAAGGVVMIGGLLLTLQARNKFDEYDQRVNDNCVATSGCAADPAFTSIKDQGNTFQTLATVSYLVGGAAVAAGVTLLFVDRSVPFRIDPNAEKFDVALREPPLAPVVGPGMAGIVATGRF